MLVRAIEPRDIPAVLSIQAATPEIAQWTSKDYELEGGDLVAAWTIEFDKSLAGFIVVRRAADEIEILNLAVVREARRQGGGTLLLKQAMAWGAQHGAAHAHLEVRESNSGAIEFYKRHGFSISGRRLRYYSSPAEDALVLSASIQNLTH